MQRTTRSVAILIASMALSAAPAFAAEPPADIAFDGVVTVVFHDPEYDDGNGIEGALITLYAVVSEGQRVFDYEATTDAEGVAVLSGVARPIDPALEIELRVFANRERTSVDPAGCTVREVLNGAAVAPAGLEVTIDVEVETQLDERYCPPEPAFIVEGNAVDPDGHALAIVHADAMLEGDLLLTIETAADGSFRVEVPAAEAADSERDLHVTLIGPDVRIVEDEEGCLTTWTLVARGSWTLIGDQAPAPKTLVAAEEPLSGVCGAPTATPDPPEAPNAPSITLPPTDAIGGSSTGVGGGISAALVLLLAISLSATIGAERRVNRRGN